MGFMDKFKDFMGLPEEDYYEEEEEPIEDSFANLHSVKREREKVESTLSYTETKRDNKVVNIHATTQLQVVLVKPERFDEAGTIADHLNAKRTVVLNLESANKEVARRLIDFLSGVAYANDGQMKKVANSTYIITPYNVGVMGDDLLDELESNGVFF